MEPEHHPIEKENNLPNLHDFGFKILIFQGAFPAWLCLSVASVEAPPQVLPRNSTLAAMSALQAFSRKVFTVSSLEGVTDSKQSWKWQRKTMW